jgi:hypothetical protein
MSTPGLERRLAEVLQQHAEDAMNSTNTEDKLHDLLGEAERGTRQRRRRTWAVGALVAAAAVAVVGVLAVRPFATDGGGDVVTTTPADPAKVSTAFLDAYGAHDWNAASSYLAQDATMDVWGYSIGADRTWDLGNAFSAAVDFRVVDPRCKAEPATTFGTEVSCGFDFHALRSAQLGRGPFADNTFTFTVLDGEIVSGQMDLAYDTDGFSKQVWEPFAAWLGRAHPHDAAVMYADWPSQSQQAITTRSNRLWEKNTREYVRLVEQGAVK